ncbi:hypothetical protein [Agromyces sp. Marseille-Q5079]|uniref:hypothetical protein n=1 Tax=Agromyces sp. Marseille-Q5079 TaxID=3439059 RepID=UPI003D9CBB3A
MKRRMRRKAGPEPDAATFAEGGDSSAENGIAGYRVLRRIASGRRAEVLLAVATRPGPDGGDPSLRPGDVAGAAISAPLVVLRVYHDDVDDLGIATELAIMEAADGAGAPELIDVAIADDGARVLVVERIAGVTVGQLLATRALDPGEAVTLIAPVVAAVSSLADQGVVHLGLSPSDVRLDATGRPRLLGLGGLVKMPGDGAQRTALRREGLAALVEYVESVVAAVRPGGVFDGVRSLMARALDARPFVPFELDLERAVFAAAPPVPVSGAASAVGQRVPARMLPAQALDHSDLDPVVEQGSPARGRRGGAASTAAGLLEVADLPTPIVERLADSLEGDRVGRLRLGIQRWIRRRKRQVIVAVLIGGAVLVVLLTAVPPTPAGAGPSVAEPGAVSGALGHVDDSDPSPTPVGEPAADDRSDASDAPDASDLLASVAEPAEAASELIRRRAECFAALELDCLRPLVQPGSPVEESDWNLMLAARDGGPGVPTLDADHVELVAEMGAAVLVRAPILDRTQPASLLIVRSEAGWRLREVFD